MCLLIQDGVHHGIGVITQHTGVPGGLFTGITIMDIIFTGIIIIIVDIAIATLTGFQDGEIVITEVVIVPAHHTSKTVSGRALTGIPIAGPG